MAEQPRPPTARVVRHHGLQLVWIIPLIAAIVAGWLGWRSYASRGPTITIRFDSGAGLEPGKTLIRHKAMALGTVQSVAPTQDLSQAIVTVRMSPAAQPYLGQDAHFWVVKPSISSKDSAGLGTFISGPYIEFQPGTGPSQREFVGEQSPTYIPAEEEGTVYTLHAAQLGSISQGATVYFHGVKVGRVLGYDIDQGGVTIRLFVTAHYAPLVHQNTRFWNTSGITVSADSTGLKMQMESVESLLSGGIAFDVPPNTDVGPVADSGANFTLYADESTADDSVYNERLRFSLHFTQPIPGLAVNSPVRLQGVAVGRVVDLQIIADKAGNIVTPAVIEIETQRMKLNGDQAENYDTFRKLVRRGLRAQAGMGSLLTGQKVIDLTIQPDAAPAQMKEGKPYPELPVIDAADMEALMKSAKELLASLKTTANDLNGAISSDNGGGDLAGTIGEVKDTARSLRVLSDYLESHPEAILNGKPHEDTP